MNKNNPFTINYDIYSPRRLYKEIQKEKLLNRRNCVSSQIEKRSSLYDSTFIQDTKNSLKQIDQIYSRSLIKEEPVEIPEKLPEDADQPLSQASQLYLNKLQQLSYYQNKQHNDRKKENENLTLSTRIEQTVDKLQHVQIPNSQRSQILDRTKSAYNNRKLQYVEEQKNLCYVMSSTVMQQHDCSAKQKYNLEYAKKLELLEQQIEKDETEINNQVNYINNFSENHDVDTTFLNTQLYQVNNWQTKVEQIFQLQSDKLNKSQQQLDQLVEYQNLIENISNKSIFTNMCHNLNKQNAETNQLVNIYGIFHLIDLNLLSTVQDQLKEINKLVNTSFNQSSNFSSLVRTKSKASIKNSSKSFKQKKQQVNILKSYFQDQLQLKDKYFLLRIPELFLRAAQKIEFCEIGDHNATQKQCALDVNFEDKCIQLLKSIELKIGQFPVSLTKNLFNGSQFLNSYYQSKFCGFPNMQNNNFTQTQLLVRKSLINMKNAGYISDINIVYDNSPIQSIINNNDITVNNLGKYIQQNAKNVNLLEIGKFNCITQILDIDKNQVLQQLKIHPNSSQIIMQQLTELKGICDQNIQNVFKLIEKTNHNPVLPFNTVEAALQHINKLYMRVADSNQQMQQSTEKCNNLLQNLDQCDTVAQKLQTHETTNLKLLKRMQNTLANYNLSLGFYQPIKHQTNDPILRQRTIQAQKFLNTYKQQNGVDFEIIQNDATMNYAYDKEIYENVQEIEYDILKSQAEYIYSSLKSMSSNVNIDQYDHIEEYQANQLFTKIELILQCREDFMQNCNQQKLITIKRKVARDFLDNLDRTNKSKQASKKIQSNNYQKTLDYNISKQFQRQKPQSQLMFRSNGDKAKTKTGLQKEVQDIILMKKKVPTVDNFYSEAETIQK